MPLKKGTSKKTISNNISEIHSGNTYSKTARKFGKSKANKQAVAIALSTARQSGAKIKNPTRSQVEKSVMRSKGY